MNNIICYYDKPGRVQHRRLQYLKEHAPFNLIIKPISDNKSFRTYSTYYYSHFSLYKKNPREGRLLASITSHKCLDNLQQTLEDLKPFERVSANNLFLYKIFKNKGVNVFYTPNGVDETWFKPLRTETRPRYFSDLNNLKSKLPRLGWIGNKDRAAKQYNLWQLLERSLQGRCRFLEIATSKRDDKLPVLLKGMVSFYNKINFLLVTSTTEGTPNPALEAMASGTPVIAPPVGNIPQLIQNGKNGFLLKEANPTEFMRVMSKIENLTEKEYKTIQKNAREIILQNWTWKKRSKDWYRFLEF